MIESLTDRYLIEYAPKKKWLVSMITSGHFDENTQSFLFDGIRWYFCFTIVCFVDPLHGGLLG